MMNHVQSVLVIRVSGQECDGVAWWGVSYFGGGNDIIEVGRAIHCFLDPKLSAKIAVKH